MRYTFRPMTWSGPSTPSYERRSKYTFKAGWHNTIDLLGDELDKLSARNVVIQADFRERDIRIDGMIRANASQPLHPGVKISFDSKHGPLNYASDTHEFWQHNVRAIALGLQALRAVDRYGITKTGEQYRGFKELPSGAIPMAMTVEQAAAFIRAQGGSIFASTAIISDPSLRREAYREAAQRSHPDRGGSTFEFQKLQDAMRVLKEYA